MYKVILTLALLILPLTLFALDLQNQQPRGTVVCLHGFLQSSKRMLPVGYELRSQGLDVILWDYPSWHKNIEEHASDLVELLQRIAEEKPGEPIHFVTHSLGGVVTRAALSHPDCPQEAKVGKAILVAPPNKGSCLGRSMSDVTPLKLFFGQHTGSQLLNYTQKEMEALGSFPSEKEVVVIAGYRGSSIFFSVPNDGKVSVNETSLTTPHKHILLDATHSWILKSRETIKIISQILLGTYDWNETPQY
jgi:pimeloyl-ACP methyl ester carboxylesterase